MLSTPSRQWFALAVLLLIAAAVRWPFTTLDFNSLLNTYLVDDAFYYFKIASHLATDHRITYDGEQLTNGFHPLWLAVITPFYTATNDGIDFVYRVQWLMWLLDLLSVVVLYRTLLFCRISAVAVWIVALIFCVHSSFVAVQMNGLETSLNTLLLLLLCYVFVAVFQQNQAKYFPYLYLGVAAGLVFLARTDNAITVFLLFSVLAWRERQSWRASYPKLLAAVAVTGVIALPWLLWNWLHFGGLVQSSGKIETIYWGEPKFSWQHQAYSLLLAPIKIYQQAQLLGRLLVVPVSNAALPAIGLLVFLIASLVWLWRSARIVVEQKALAVFCVCVLAVFFYHAVFRSFVRTWYYMPVGLVCLLLLASFLSALPRYWSICLGVLVVASVLWNYSLWRLPTTVHEQSSHLQGAEWINANTPQDAVVGSMNSGVLSYLVQRKVINLDGVVDVRSMRAHWEKRQPEYIHERGISYLVDNDGALQFFCRENPLHTCVPVFTFGDKSNSNKVVKIVKK